MATRTRTKKIDVDTHFLPRLDYQELKELLTRSQLPEVQDMLFRDALRFADPSGVRAAMKGEPRPDRDGGSPDPHRDPEERVKSLMELGWDMQVLIPDGTFMNLYGATPSGGDRPLETRTALCKLYNNAVAAAQRRFPDRFVGAAIIPFDDLEESSKEVTRAVKELGLRAVIIPGNWMGKNYDTFELYPFWATLNDLDVPALVHHVPQGCLGSAVDHTPRYPMIGMERMRRLHLGTYLGFGLEYSLACAALTLGGVLDEFPNLRFCFFEAGATWLVYAMYGCDRSFLIEPQCSRTPTLPSELMRRHCFTAVEPMEHISQLVAAIGNENFFFGSDFPHPEYETFQSTAEAIAGREGLSEQDKENILGGNIARVLKMV